MSLLKYFLKQNSWLRIAIYSFYITILLGLLLRLEYSGLFTYFSGSVDLRRAHSHLGFYGFLFPLLWWRLQKYGFWIPEGKLRVFYIVLLFLSTLGFAVSGYGVLSHVSSFFILIIWLVFSFKNIKFKSHGLLSSIPYAIFLASILLVFVLLTRLDPSVSMQKVVRVFLITLMFGVFGTLSLYDLSKPKFPVFVWLATVVGLGLVLSNLSFGNYFIWAPAALGVLVIHTLFKSLKVSFSSLSRVKIYWLLLSMAFLLISFGVVKNNHFTAIAGIHFFILLIYATQFLVFKNSKFAYIYEVSSLLMTALIFSPNVISWPYRQNQIALVIVSGILVVTVLLGVRAPKLKV